MLLCKDDVVKDIKRESLIGDYLSAGWKIYKEEKKEEKEEEAKENFIGKDKNKKVK